MTITNNEQKYRLAICELFNPYFHAFDYHSDSTIQSQYLIFETVDIDSFYNNDYKISIQFLKSNSRLSQCRDISRLVLHCQRHRCSNFGFPLSLFIFITICKGLYMF